MGAKSKQAKRVRQKQEFKIGELASALAPPKDPPNAYAWKLTDIVGARNEQLRGVFKQPARMAAAMRTDPAIAVPWTDRLEPLRCLDVELVPAKTGQGAKIALEAEGLVGKNGVAITADTVADIQDSVVNHGVGFAQCMFTPRADGSRVDMTITPWPIDPVRWDEMDGVYKTQTDGGVEVPIVHGDGRWLVFKKHDVNPFQKQAALLSACLVWATHAYSRRDWSKGSLAHGTAKVLGELPLGVALRGKDGKMSPEAAAMFELLRLIATGDTPIGIRPAGSKIDFLTNLSTAWQVWSELAGNSERWGARIYTGTDAILGSKGGAPGVDIQALFGVKKTLVDGDVRCFNTGFHTAVEIWTAINFGDSALAPRRLYKLPDTDAAARLELTSKKRMAFFADIEKTRATGFTVSKKYVEQIAAEYETEPPELPEQKTKPPTITLAPTDVARVVTVNEARASVGCDPLQLENGTPDPDGKLTLEQFSVKKAAEVAPPPPASGVRDVA